ncbi:MAG: hypothetical protein IJ214_11565 [Clostridia bacterium]|nr:hypothetical protein [Clostridia bacterium]
MAESVIRRAAGTSSYASPTYTDGTATNGSAYGVRCIKYENGMIRITGLFKVTSEKNADEVLFTLPAGYIHAVANNGGMRFWGSITNIATGVSHVIHIANKNVCAYGSSLPVGTYMINVFYF